MLDETELERKRQASREAARRYYERNRETIKAKNLEYSRKPEVRERIKTLKRGSKSVAVTKKAWRQANPHKVVAYKRRRKGLEVQATPPWTNSEWENFLMSEIYLLAKLRTKVTGFEWHVDHSIPLKSEVVCGLHCSANLRVIPAVFNLSKGNKHDCD